MGMNDKQKLAAMGALYRLTEEQAKGLAERMPQTGALQVIDDEPLCMAKRIEELEAQVRVMAELLREAAPMISGYGNSIHNEAYRDEDYTESERAFDLEGRIEAALAGKLPARAIPEDCAMLYVGSGMFAKCDWEDWPRVMGYWWRLSTERGSTRYAQAHDSHDTLKRKRVAMHRLILSARDGDVVDHINGDGLDNRRSNLRIATIQQNAFNQKHHGGSSRHKGVSYRADSGTWRAYITKDGKRRYLGTFASEDDAARAYNNEAERLFGEHAKLNAAAPSLDSAK
jgi:hypothetical protein